MTGEPPFSCSALVRQTTMRSFIRRSLQRRRVWRGRADESNKRKQIAEDGEEKRTTERQTAWIVKDELMVRVGPEA